MREKKNFTKVVVAMGSLFWMQLKGIIAKEWIYMKR
jgi:hypothetical protein